MKCRPGCIALAHFLRRTTIGLDPDIVVLAKALSGGLIPVSATLMSDAVYSSVYSSMKRAIVHASTFSENSLAMRAGLATLEVLEREQLGKRATSMGMRVAAPLDVTNFPRYEMVKAVRGIGLLLGIEFDPPRSPEPSSSFRSILEDSSGHVRADHGHAIVPRPRNSHPDLWKRFHGLESCASVGGLGNAGGSNSFPRFGGLWNSPILPPVFGLRRSDWRGRAVNI